MTTCQNRFKMSSKHFLTISTPKMSTCSQHLQCQQLERVAISERFQLTKDHFTSTFQSFSFYGTLKISVHIQSSTDKKQTKLLILYHIHILSLKQQQQRQTKRHSPTNAVAIKPSTSKYRYSNCPIMNPISSSTIKE